MKITKVILIAIFGLLCLAGTSNAQLLNQTSNATHAKNATHASNATASKWFIPDVCPTVVVGHIGVACPLNKTRGCACYANGTCAVIQSNHCAACAIANLTSFNEDESCPQLYNHKLYTCEAADQNAVCSKIFPPLGCLCLEDGTCSRMHVNKCQGCAKPNAVSVVEGGHCPLKVSAKNVTANATAAL